MKKSMCTCTWTFLSIKKIYLHSIFSSFRRKNMLVGSRRKHLDPNYHLFFFPSTQLNTLQKYFPSYILLKVFYPPSFTSKQSHVKENCFVYLLSFRGNNRSQVIYRTKSTTKRIIVLFCSSVPTPKSQPIPIIFNLY